MAAAGSAARAAPIAAADRLELAVSVELVPEKVVHHDQPGNHGLHRQRQAGLVNLEDRKVRAGPTPRPRSLDHSRCEPGHQVGAGPVGHDPVAAGA